MCTLHGGMQLHKIELHCHRRCTLVMYALCHQALSLSLSSFSITCTLFHPQEGRVFLAEMEWHGITGIRGWHSSPEMQFYSGAKPDLFLSQIQPLSKCLYGTFLVVAGVLALLHNGVRLRRVMPPSSGDLQHLRSGERRSDVMMRRFTLYDDIALDRIKE